MVAAARASSSPSRTWHRGCARSTRVRTGGDRSGSAPRRLQREGAGRRRARGVRVALTAGLPVVSVQAPFLCPAFWQTALPEWSGQLDGAAVEGVLAEAPSPIHAGAARAVALDIQAGSEARHRAQIAPLNPAAHPVVTTLTAGERVRLVGLRARPDGVLVPGVRTSCSGLTIYHSWPRDVKQQSLRRSTTTPNSMQLTALHAAADAGH